VSSDWRVFTGFWVLRFGVKTRRKTWFWSQLPQQKVDLDAGEKPFSWHGTCLQAREKGFRPRAKPENLCEKKKGGPPPEKFRQNRFSTGFWHQNLAKFYPPKPGENPLVRSPLLHPAAAAFWAVPMWLWTSARWLYYHFLRVGANQMSGGEGV
jgi:hypothetical protein